MALDFGGGGLFGQDKTLQTADYRTAGSHQAENVNYHETTAVNTWQEIHTVTAGKTYYVSGIIMSGVASLRHDIGIGASGSETAIMAAYLVGGLLSMALETPMKFTSGTRIAVRCTGTGYFTLIGWEE